MIKRKRPVVGMYRVTTNGAGRYGLCQAVMVRRWWAPGRDTLVWEPMAAFCGGSGLASYTCFAEAYAAAHKHWKVQLAGMPTDIRVDDIQFSPSDDPRCMTLLELIDGAKTVMELWEAESPAQRVWKTQWLTSAREYLTSEQQTRG